MKSNTRKYNSKIKEVIHQTALDLHEAGLMDNATMRRFDASCLTQIRELSAPEIRAIRKRESVSQAVFAFYLNVTKDSVSQWERGLKKPAGPALKLLSLVLNKGLSAIA